MAQTALVRSKDLAELTQLDVQVIAEHFFHEGNFKVGDCFLREAHVADGDTIRQPFMAMHSILEQVRRTLFCFFYPFTSTAIALLGGDASRHFLLISIKLHVVHDV